MRIVHVGYHVVNVRTRMPFRYGIASLTACPHLFVRVEAEVGGRRQVGVAADNLPPKWFTKDPGTSYADDLRDMIAVIRKAGEHAVEAGDRGTVYAWWRAVYERQKAWAGGTNHPPLLWNFGVSLVERAGIDAFCRAEGVAFGEALRSGRLGIDVAGWLPRRPVAAIRVRHTVGLSDPLTAGDVVERIDDGLPQTLEESIRAYGLTHFKIKLSGDTQRDRERLGEISRLLERESPGYRYTLDGNESFREVGAFRAMWESLVVDERLRGFLDRLIFVEQPLQREVALAEDLRGWAGRPAMIIDESDDQVGAVERALEVGYVGTSHKNCKGVFKSVLNAERLERRKKESGAGYVLSGEDLTNVGPVALPQDLAVLAALGVKHAERNGQHYVRGLSAFSEDVQREVVRAHGDLYRWHERGFATVRVEGGEMATGSVSAAPFGYGMAFDPGRFEPLEGWDGARS